MRRETPDCGEVAEWSNAAVLKTVEVQASQGSNPCLSARRSAAQLSQNVRDVDPATLADRLYRGLCQHKRHQPVFPGCSR